MLEKLQYMYPNTVTDKEYLEYGPEQDPVHCREYYFKDCLQLSEWFDGAICLLNPHVQHEGEWEVIYYATWRPGARRYRSFREFIEALIIENKGSNAT